jgi:hypothetical protein
MEGLMAIIVLFSIVYGVILFFLPFFVYRIRNETIAMNEKMSKLIALLGTQAQEGGSNLASVDERGRKIKKCPSCGIANRYEDIICFSCNKPLILTQRG